MHVCVHSYVHVCVHSCMLEGERVKLVEKKVKTQSFITFQPSSNGIHGLPIIFYYFYNCSRYHDKLNVLVFIGQNM